MSIRTEPHDDAQRQEVQDAFERFQERQRRNHQVRAEVLETLAAVLEPRVSSIPAVEGTSLLVAASAVGEVLGVTIRPPVKSEDPTKVREPLEAIARASHLRMRRVLLTGTWWKHDCGPLLAYTREGHRPVALLPISATRYGLFDPVRGTRTPVHARLAPMLVSEAYTFYRPFPNTTFGSLDLLRFGLRGRGLGTFLAFHTAFGTFIGGATSLSNTIIALLDVAPLWERARPILEATPEVHIDSADPGRLTGKLAVDHVTFRYQEHGPIILKGVSLHAEPGECIALVGPSGSGKSTVLRLLLGLDTPESGAVYYDDQDLARLDVTAVRQQLGTVLQQSAIMAATIFENIASGGLITLEDAWEAARTAGLAEDIAAMPMGMHTLVSEGGSNLSGGQRQRLLIARALVHKPTVVLFDEATSALDNRTQAIVTASLERLRVTRVIIAHRLSTIRHADRIYVLEQGRIVQQGRFTELAQQDGLFAQLMARQEV